MTSAEPVVAVPDEAEKAVAAKAKAVADMKSEADRRLAAMASKAKPDSSASKDAAGAKPVPTAPAKESAKAPEAEKGPDLSWVPEKHRESFSRLNKEALDYLRTEYGEETGKLRFSDYTKKNQGVSEREKGAKASEDKISFAEAILREPKLLEAVRQADAELRGAAAPHPQEAFDPITSTPEQFQAHLNRLKKEAGDEAFNRFTAMLDEKEKSQAAQVLMAKAAKEAFVDSGDYEAQVVNATYDKLVALGAKLDKDNVVDALREFLPAPKPKAKPQESVTSAGSSGYSSQGVSPLIRAGGSSPPVTTPSFIAQGKQPSNLAERIAYAKWQANRTRAAQNKPPIDT